MPNKQNSKTGSLAKHHGFTLIELIIGIVVLAISFSVITSLIIPTTVQSANQLHQIRAAELGQTLMNEILARSFDENSDHAGGLFRCQEQGVECTGTISSIVSLGVDVGESRDQYNDVDDFYCYDPSSPDKSKSYELPCANPANWNIAPYSSDIYSNYRVAVNVFYDGNYDGVDDNDYAVAKHIGLSIRTPSGEEINLTTYKVNF
ncbi:prepilin-type N-terminal cleavage/methylation domain-containing protein [Thalassotalea euphylliae]|uniref:Prepilin-type N-terminal cleavage/methylation domain-containing protein n=1 Tax=Thalassotalea euphylliae TaxID=1655234 RepID=A0A3E0TW52_9GAMM|nr:prepilin-type N-terminal cleavage/methylation domain-containing protein [Thalassotalea euphylliae]REL28162.1 prepilin-type N-terminal cleavage/methylation domain-containing protein [Thalassotalea euphylliae]